MFFIYSGCSYLVISTTIFSNSVACTLNFLVVLFATQSCFGFVFFFTFDVVPFPSSLPLSLVILMYLRIYFLTQSREDLLQFFCLGVLLSLDMWVYDLLKVNFQCIVWVRDHLHSFCWISIYYKCIDLYLGPLHFCIIFRISLSINANMELKF